MAESKPLKPSKNRWAWVYLLGIPLSLGIFLLQGGMLLRTLSLEAALSRAAAVVDRCNAILSLLQQARAATGSGASNFFEGANSSLRGALQQLQHLGKTDPATQAEYERLATLVKSQTDQWQRIIASKLSGRSPVSAAGSLDNQYMPEIDRTIFDIRRGEEAYMQKETDAAMHSLHVTVSLFKFGGAFVLWILVAVIFLLFYSQKKRAMANFEDNVSRSKRSSKDLSVN